MGALCFRVDASAEVGAGHAMRCLALAQASIDRGGRVAFLMAETTPAIDGRLGDEGVPSERIRSRPGSPEDARETADAARRHDADWVVVDGYHFDGSYLEALKAAGPSVLAIEDHVQSVPRNPDLILNQTLHARLGSYRHCAPGTRLLLGSRYVLLRREFRGRARPPERTRRRVPSILVSLGAADIHGVTEVVLHALAKLGRGAYRATVALGPMNDRRPALEALSVTLGLPVRFESDVRDMAALMGSADLAIAAGGTTSWELAFMGVPSLLIVLADNQRGVAESLDRAGVSENLGPWQKADADAVARPLRSLLGNPARRAKMAERGRKLLDGAGPDRVLRALSVPRLTLRSVREEDSRRVWEWANEPGTRGASFSKDPIPWDDHATWFRSKLADAQCHFFLATDPAGQLVGQIRFDVQGDDAEVSVSLDPRVRGRGYGAALIQLGSQKLFAETNVRTIHAYTKEGNEASIRAFLDAGYEDLGVTEIRGHRALHFAVRTEADG